VLELAAPDPFDAGATGSFAVSRLAAPPAPATQLATVASAPRLSLLAKPL